MLRFLLPLYAALLLATALSAQTPDEPLRGLLWEISGNNIAQKGYLYGTMHVPEKLAFNLSDSFFIALRQVDIVALETDHDRWQEFTELLDGRESELFNPGYGNSYPGSGRSLPQPNLYNAQFQLSAPDNPLLGAMLSAKPRLTNEFLYRSNQYRQDYEEDTYLDLFIFQAGRKLGKSVIGLETLEDSYEALVRAQLPDEEEEESSHRDHYTGSLGRQTLEDAYRDQNLSLMDSLNRLASPGKNFQRWMLDERNLVMVDGIDSILQSGHAVFAAVGAAHLPGASGLIRQLRERGYRLRPVGFSADSSKLEKDRIDALRYPLQFSRQWAADSSWSVEAPGRFFQTVDGMGLEQQLCADMSNGAYYAVYRLQSFGLWQGQSPEYIAERIDSLIYEKVPGKIQERRRFSSPYPGHEILTRTRRGDAIRYKVVVSPMEVYVFATGGNGDYAAGEEGARFINSIAFGLKTSGTEAGSFTRLSPPEGGFSLTFPGTTVLNTTNNPKTDRYLAASVDPVDSAFYLFYRASFHDWNYIEEDSFELNIISEKIAEQFTEAAPECQLVVETPYPTQDAQFQAERDSAWYYLRLIIAGPNYYLLGCRKKQAGAPRSFFESFELQERQYPKGWETLRDTSMFFTAEIPHAALKPDRPFFTRLQRVIQEAMQKSRRGGGFNSNGSGNQVRILQLPLQGEAVSIGSFTLQNPGGG
ncbi:MAG: TraB/GumN family protein, partial [Saprospiraceae bacterium]|nr:TraB/GumN family protein [Saprospiraceae bacterium]